jgi:putative membrane protein
MKNLANVLTALVLLEHVYIVWMEMFAWETAGKRSFGKALPADLFKPTKGLAANQGLYNGFLVAGLAWSFFINDPVWSGNVRLFFLGCVLVAGVFGGITASKKIFFVQGVPALLAILSMIFLK